jgi:hypothetical protein
MGLMNKSATSQSEKGQSILELIVVIPFIALIIAVALGLGPLGTMQLAVQQSANDCAFQAAQSLDPGQVVYQGRFAAYQTIDLYHLSAARTRVAVSGNFERGGSVQCSVTYDVPVGNFPFGGIINLPSTVFHTVTLPIQALRSDWSL